jgi:hypothetical protein
MDPKRALELGRDAGFFKGVADAREQRRENPLP